METIERPNVTIFLYINHCRWADLIDVQYNLGNDIARMVVGSWGMIKLEIC
jgi:hypothetical protein